MHNGLAQGLAEFALLNFDLPLSMAAIINFEKPRCPPVPCSALLCVFVIVFYEVNI
jgi:hypothetical protein